MINMYVCFFLCCSRGKPIAYKYIQIRSHHNTHKIAACVLGAVLCRVPYGFRLINNHHLLVGRTFDRGIRGVRMCFVYLSVVDAFCLRSCLCVLRAQPDLRNPTFIVIKFQSICVCRDNACLIHLPRQSDKESNNTTTTDIFGGGVVWKHSAMIVTRDAQARSVQTVHS